MGKESVLLYTSDLYASLMPDNKRLRAFDKIELKPGETQNVKFKLKASDLAFVFLLMSMRPAKAILFRESVMPI